MCFSAFFLPYLRKVRSPYWDGRLKGVVYGLTADHNLGHMARAMLEGIAYPVRYKASFESSDPRLNKIWETAAYTAHLCMQEGIWDGVKRDRGKWMGDMDVTARVIGTVFGDHAQIDQTLQELAGTPPFSEHVNSLASYTPLWVIGEAENDRRFLPRRGFYPRYT